jgi:hypothetical protein
MSLPLPTLTFYRLADVTPAASTIQGLLDAIYGADYTTDYRARSLASTHLWTKARYQNAGTTEAVYFAAPSGTPMTLVPKIIFAGAAAGSPTMYVDTILASALHVGINKNSGAFNAWTAALPFTSGQFSGFTRVGPTALNSTATTVRIYVSEEIIILDIWSSATAHYPVIVGATLEAYTQDTSSAMETDERLYGAVTQGSTAALSTTFLTTSAGTFLDHSTSNGAPHAFVFQPGTSSIYGAGRDVLMQSAAAVGGEVDPTNAHIGRAITFARSTANNIQNGAALGRLREVYFLGAVQGAQTRYSGSGASRADLFHVVGTNSGAADDAFAIKAVA